MTERDYETDRIRVRWNSSLCLHTARCIRRAPDVFDSTRRPWVQLDGADPDDVADAVARCPTGALSFERLDRDEATAVESAVIELQRNGPYYVRGPVTVRSVDGVVVARGPRVALCRCGGTKNAPFCDNTHRAIGFVDPATGGTSDRDAPSDPRPPS